MTTVHREETPRRRACPPATGAEPVPPLGFRRLPAGTASFILRAMSEAMGGRYAVNAENARWRVVDGEAVVINLTNTYYYGLNKTGTFIWSLLVEAERTVDDLVAAVALRYGRSAAAVSSDVHGVLEELTRENLVVRR